MDIKKLRVCTSNDKQFLKEFSDVFESRFDELGGNWLKHKNCNTTLDSHWFFRTKLWELVKVRYDIGTKTVEELPDLSGFDVCTANERKFLDEIRENWRWDKQLNWIMLAHWYMEPSPEIISILHQECFEANLKELVNE